MKKILILGIVLSLSLAIFADVKQADNSYPTPANDSRSTAVQSRSMTEPVISWGITPKTIKTADYYDYMIGAYDGNALAVQPTTLGVYMSYMHKVSASGRRGANFAYMNQSVNEPQYEGGLTTKTANEGFVTMSLDPVTENPFFAWHAQYNAADNGGTADPFMNCYLTADNFSTLSSPGSPFGKIKVIENSSDEFEYTWPVVMVGQSSNPNMRRVFVFGSNGGNKPNGNPSSDIKMAYADFDNTLFDGAELNLTWNYVTFPYLQAIHNTPLTARAFPSYAVSGNKVILGGFVSADDGISAANDSTNIIYQPHNVFYLVNENYGEGDFTLYTFNTNRSVPNPTNQGGVDDGTGYVNFSVQDSYSNHRNLVFDNFNRVHFVGNYATTFLENAQASESDRKFWPVSQSVKDVIFDLNSHEVKITALEPKTSSMANNQLFPVWDLNGDDVPDTYDTEDGSWEFQWNLEPEYFHQSDDWFHYNYFRQTKATPQGWMVALWNDCTKSYAYNVNTNEEYADYASVPELAMVFSRDNGRTWSNAKYINSINTPELAEMIPAFAYLAPEIQVMDDNTGRIHIMFLDDNSYGSYIQSDGANTGGNVMYAAIDVDFDQFTANDNPVVNVKPAMLKQNYPNPFNPTTTISFNINNAENVNLSIFNVKGQLVKTLVNNRMTAGNHEVVWNGLDNNNNQAASGVYFYKLSTSKNSEMKKMILVK
jgi:hypothetical protein